MKTKKKKKKRSSTVNKKKPLKINAELSGWPTINKDLIGWIAFFGLGFFLYKYFEAGWLIFGLIVILVGLYRILFIGPNF